MAAWIWMEVSSFGSDSLPVSGLFSAGEVAGGVHGNIRLGGYFGLCGFRPRGRRVDPCVPFLGTGGGTDYRKFSSA